MDRNKYIERDHFSGHGHLQDQRSGGLADIVRSILISRAAAIMNASTVADFTADNSGGAAGVVFTAANATSLMTLTEADSSLPLGEIVYVANSGGGLPNPLAAATAYYYIPVSATTFKLASSLANARRGIFIDLTTDGTGTQTLVLALGRTKALTSSNLTGLTTGATAASIDTGAATIRDAYRELLTKVNLSRAELGLAQITLVGTAADGTIGAIDDAAAANANDTDAASIASVQALVDKLITNEKVALMAINDLRVAVGLRAIQDLGERAPAQLPNSYPASFDRGTMVALTAAANVNPPTAAVLLAEIDALFDLLSDNFATLVDGWQEVGLATALPAYPGGYVAA